MDSIDRELINRLQRQFPLTKEPFTSLGAQLGIKEDDVIHRVTQLKANKIIRQISPVMDARHLGYQTTLVAMKMPESQLDEAAQIIAAHPGVSHSYDREHPINLWFTLAIPPTVNLEIELEQLTGPINAEVCFALPAIKLFKIGACFAMGGNVPSSADNSRQSNTVLPGKVKLSQKDKSVINILQQDLPLVTTPFTDMAVQLSMETEDFLTQCQSLLQRGIMRRFGASLNHRKAGFNANAMACWIVPHEKVDTVGRKLAARQEVSHCYERKTNPLWPYNLFAMIHGRGREACREIASTVAEETGLADYILLFSTRELKKVRVKYLV